MDLPAIVTTSLSVAGLIVRKDDLRTSTKTIGNKVLIGGLFATNVVTSLLLSNLSGRIDAAIDDEGWISAAKLKEIIASGGTLKKPKLVKIKGNFFAGTLLTFGWWERGKSNRMPQMDWKDDSLQNWLFSGFEQWAPSWDINEEHATNSIKLMGQIGTNDEADSIPVIVKSDGVAKRIRADMGNDLVARTRVTGTLCTVRHLRDSLTSKSFALVRALIGANRHIILVDDDERHSVRRRDDQPVTYYSGYLWQCVAPREAVQPGAAASVEIEKSYFLWEHTNFADRDVINFNLDSLKRKREFVGERVKRLKWDGQDLSGDLVLVQRLMADSKLRGEAVVEEEPVIKVGDFYRLFNEALHDGA